MTSMRCLLLTFFAMLGMSASALSATQCNLVAQQAANFEYQRAFADCLNGGPGNPGGGAPACRSDWECSTGESCIANRCVIRPTCDSTIRCDECFLGQRTCRVINCRGELVTEYDEQCSATNTYACGACQDPSSTTGTGRRYTYPVYLENQEIARNGPYNGLQACMNARATDPRCNGN
jgi:hypothetical protein